MDPNAFSALKRDSIDLNLHDVHNLIFDEMMMNHEQINDVLVEMIENKDLEVRSSLQERFDRLIHMNDGLRSLLSKIAHRLQQHDSLADTTPAEPPALHPVSPRKVSDSTVFHSKTRLLPEEILTSAGSDGNKEADQGKENRTKLHAVGGQSV